MKTLVVRFIVLGFVGLLLALLAGACANQGEPFQPIRPGEIESTKVEGSVSGRWIKANSPYYVMKPISVGRTRKLTIDPGVTVVFTDKGRTMTVLGELDAIGKRDTVINFRASFPPSGQPSPGDWTGITLSGRNNELKHVRIRYAATGLTMTEGSETAIDSSTFSNNQADGIRVTRADLTIRNSILANNTVNGLQLIGCEDPQNRILIDHCNIGNNGYAGILSLFSSALIVRTDIKDNGNSCLGAPPEGHPDSLVFNCAGAIFKGTPGVKLPFFRMCNVTNNYPREIRNMMDGDLVVSADSTYWGRINAGIMDNLSTPDPSEPPNPAFCAFNVPCIWDGYDLGKGIPTVRFCYWRDQPWDNGYGATAPRPIDWAAPAARWR